MPAGEASRIDLSVTQCRVEFTRVGRSTLYVSCQFSTEIMLNVDEYQPPTRAVIFNYRELILLG